MIEVLVAFVIFSFGMLGIAGLQTRLITYSQGSLFRSQAMALTDDILDRMRADRTHAIGGDWNTALDDTATSLPTGTQLHEFDLRDWKTQVESLLPEGRASVLVDAAQNNLVTITIQWNDSRGTDSTNAAGTVDFVTRTRL
jgi:type IV pilus assembly protein PilV